MGAGQHQIRGRLWALGLLCCALALLGCREKDPSLRRVQEAGVLRVGLDPSWPPFEYVDPAGQLVGLDVDLARALAARLGVEAAFVPGGWEGLYGALAAGQFDVILSALPYDPWRTHEVVYSTSYWNAGPAIAAHPEALDLQGPRDLAGRTVHVEFGSEGHMQVRRLAKKIRDLEIVTHETADEALAAAAGDPAAAAVADTVSLRLFIRQGGRLRLVGEPLYDESYVIAMPHDAGTLHRAIDQALSQMRLDGTLDELIARWL